MVLAVEVLHNLLTHNPGIMVRGAIERDQRGPLLEQIRAVTHGGTRDSLHELWEEVGHAELLEPELHVS